MENGKIKLIVAMLIFGSVGLFVKNIDLSSSMIALVRGIIGSIFLFTASYITRQNTSWKAIKSNLIPLIISGAAIGVNWIFLFQAYKYTTVSKATLCYYFAPVIVMFLSPFILKEKLNTVKIMCIIVAMAGMFLIVGAGSSAAENNQLLGIIYGLAAAALYASVIIINKFIKNLSGMESGMIQLTAAAVVLLPYVFVTEKVSLSQLGFKSIVLLLAVGIIHTGIAYLLYFSAILKLKGQTIAIFSYIDPISAIVMSSIFLGERMTFIQVLGGILILGTTFINELWGKKSDAKEYMLD
ncbi:MULTISPECIES: DMT family transporter [Clostridium]|uniref:EamA/RhaT family transporter n=4 Tax=Clostridium TaxID=1485 RepID=A0A3M0SXF2_9CLOT|nr:MULTISPECIES: DMT family transporter [Clostridium]AGY74257.1 DMT family transporter [Clostridium autoethanogenum DSM 10061]ALU34448.1 EamA-like transporter family membrane protein [Clostridium autoethanogenum DSM 10061]OAA87666.1 threonine and homoserine efflux system [Clostridium ljungdahlii DSM 13528]OVY51168.1 threonine and homoserine efflux system [Clostridium autoethanogenum]RMD02532.1 EamA/RhaT family transporter [Clostridium autoethanogenum]